MFVFGTGVLAANNNWIVYGGTGTGNWDDANHWSLGHSPTSSEMAIFDASSFNGAGQSVTVRYYQSIGGMNWTGVTNKPTFASTGGSFSLYGSVTLVNSTLMTVTFNKEIDISNTSGTVTITSAGQTIPSLISVQGSGGTTELGDNASFANFGVSYGTFNTNAHSMNLSGYCQISGSPNPTFNMSGSTITCARWTVYQGLNFTVDSTSKIIMTGANTFTGAALTYNEVDLNSSGTTTIAGSNTFSKLVLPSGTTQTIKFTDGTTQHITTATLSGSSGHVHTLTGTSTAGWNIVKDGGGAAYEDWVTITYSVASPANSWYYEPNSTYNSTSGWTSYAPPTPPTITISAASLILNTSARLNGNITATGGENPAVTMYWGASDGGQTPGSWTYSATGASWTSPGTPTEGVGAFYEDVTGLTAGHLYYFSASATNSGGTSWATASLSFTTATVIIKINGIAVGSIIYLR